MATIEEMIDKIERYVLKRQIGIAEILAREFLNDARETLCRNPAMQFFQSSFLTLKCLNSFLRERKATAKAVRSSFAASEMFTSARH